MEALQPYYELTGAAAITLMGLLFVVIALAAERLGPDDKSCLELSSRLRRCTSASCS
jgi:hypothetical protein